MFGGDFSQICAVKRSVLHLEAIYFCHSTCRLVEQDGSPMEKQLALYREIGLIPPGTVAFFEGHRAPILQFWPGDAALSERPELLYEALLANELCIRPDRIWFQQDKVSRDIAGAYYTSSDFSAKITRRALDTYFAEVAGSSAAWDKLAGTTFLDYACGCGEFLLAVLDYFRQSMGGYPQKKLATQLKGVDVDPLRP